ncbi:MAG: hypothetical protein WCP17_00060 [bacterium]
MKKDNLIRFVQSLIFLPVMTTSLSLGGVHNTDIAQNVLFQKLNIEFDGKLAINEAAPSKDQIEAGLLKAKTEKAEAIDFYFDEHDMPLEGTGMKMVEAAERNELDWRLLPAIAVRESTGGKNDCIKVDHNAFGWGSCKIGFKSDEAAIDVVARNLGGNNPKTAHHYGDKTTKQILRAYNPPSIVPRYAEQVMSIMDTIGEADNVAPTPPILNT